MLSRSLLAVRPGVTLAKRLYSAEAAAGLSVSKLANGVTLVSLENDTPAAAVGVFIKSGSRFEDFDTNGSAHFLKHMAYKSTHSLSSIRVTRLIESLANTFNVESGREGIQYKAETTSVRVPDLLQVLGDVLQPRLPEWEVRDQREAVAEHRQLLLADPSVALSEAVHFTAFRGTGLGRPSIAPSFQIEALTHEALQQYVASNYVGNRIVVACVGIDHETFVEYAEDAFGSLPAGSAVEHQAQPYTGGESISVGGSGSQVALAFKGVPFSSDDFVTARALSLLLGGGVQAKGAPGAGLTSRLYQTLSRTPSLRSASAWSLSYSDAGLFGVQANAATGSAPAVTELLAKELSALKNISDEEAARAVALSRAAVVNSTETRLGLIEFIGKQALAGTGTIQLPSSFLASPQFAVTAADLKRVAKQILSSTPTLVATGDVAGIPTLDRVRQLISS